MPALDDLAASTGVDRSVLAFLDDADGEELATLASAVRRARAQRDAELQAAVDRALRIVPRPLRGRIRKLVGGGRG